MERGKENSENQKGAGTLRPFLLTLICLFSFIFFGLISLLFLFALIFSGSITDMILKYAPENSPSRITVLIYILGGFLLHGLSFTGVFLIWKMKRLGYLLFGISSLILATYQLFATHISPLTTSFYIALIILFGLFIKKLH